MLCGWYQHPEIILQSRESIAAHAHNYSDEFARILKHIQSKEETSEQEVYGKEK